MRGKIAPKGLFPGSPQCCVSQDNSRYCGGIQRGAGAPLCVVAEEGVTGEKPHRKGFSSRAVFRFTFGRPKVNRGVRGRVAPEMPSTETRFL